MIGLALNLRLLLAYGQHSVHASSENDGFRRNPPGNSAYEYAADESGTEDFLRTLALYSGEWHERVSLEDDRRIPRRVDSTAKGNNNEKRKMEFFRPQDALEILPREIPSDNLPSTPELNAIMDRAMTKVKSLLFELEKDKGREDKTRVTNDPLGQTTVPVIFA